MDYQSAQDSLRLKRQNEKLVKLNQALRKQVDSLKTELIQVKKQYSDLHQALIDCQQKNLSEKKYNYFMDIFQSVMRISENQNLSILDVSIPESSSIYSELHISYGQRTRQNTSENRTQNGNLSQQDSQPSISINDSQFLKMNYTSPLYEHQNIQNQSSSNFQHISESHQQLNTQSEQIQQSQQEISQSITYSQLLNQQKTNQQSNEEQEESQSNQQNRIKTRQDQSNQSSFSWSQNNPSVKQVKQLHARMNPQVLYNLYQNVYQQEKSLFNLNHTAQLQTIYQSTRREQLKTQQPGKDDFEEADQSAIIPEVVQDNQLQQEIQQWVDQSDKKVVSRVRIELMQEISLQESMKKYKFIYKLFSDEDQYAIDLTNIKVDQYNGSYSLNEFTNLTVQFIKSFDKFTKISFKLLVLDNKLNRIPKQYKLQFLALNWSSLTTLKLGPGFFNRSTLDDRIPSLQKTLEKLEFTTYILWQHALNYFISSQFQKLHSININLLNLTSESFEVIKKLKLSKNTELKLFKVRGNDLMEIGSYSSQQQRFIFKQGMDLSYYVLSQESMSRKRNYLSKSSKLGFAYTDNFQFKWSKVLFLKLPQYEAFQQFIEHKWEQVRTLDISYLDVQQNQWRRMQKNAESFCNVEILTIYIELIEIIGKVDLKKLFPILFTVEVVYSYDKTGQDKTIYLLSLVRQLKELNPQIQFDTIQDPNFC